MDRARPVSDFGLTNAVTSLRSLWAGRRRFDAPIQPAVPFFAVGDVHGRDDLVLRLVPRMEAAADRAEAIVFVGDYIDRGERSVRTLQLLHEITQAMPNVVRCLTGNHEQMLLEFLDEPDRFGPAWMRHGGMQTLASVGLRPLGDTASAAAWARLRNDLRDALGRDLEAWLRALPIHWQSGNVVVSHAGANPRLGIDLQRPRDFIWGHPDFAEQVRDDGIWIVHGHTIVEQPTIADGKICVDTGAYATGRLSAAFVAPGTVRFVST